MQGDSDSSLQEPHDLIPNKVALVMDIMGSGVKSDETFTIVYYPAGTLRMVTSMLQQAQLRLNTQFVVFYLGTNVVMDFDRSDIIGKVIHLCKVTREKYPNISIFLSTLVPRPVDHQITARAVINYNDALKTGAQVANRRYTPVHYVSSHHLFVLPDGSYREDLYHKQDLRLSKKGVRLFKDNIRSMLHID